MRALHSFFVLYTKALRGYTCEHAKTMNEYAIMGSNNYAVYIARRIPADGTDTPVMVAQALYETKEEWHGGRYMVIYDITDQLVICTLVGAPGDCDADCETLSSILKSVLTDDGIPLYLISTIDDGVGSVTVNTNRYTRTDSEVKYTALKAGNPWEFEFLTRFVR